MMARFVCGVAVAATLAALPGSLVAQGFQVNEHGTCVMGRAGVGTPKPCGDGSAIFYNPAGIAGMEGATVSVGVTGIYAYGDFVDDYTGTKTDLDNPLVPVPHAFVAYGITPQLTAGLGFFVPYGLGTKWPTTFEGRFNGYDNDLRSLYFQPTVAYQIHPMIAIGAGFDFVLGSVTLTQRVDLSEQGVPGQTVTFGNLGIPYHTDFADAKLEAHNATGFGGNVGILIKPHEAVSIGARYLSRVKLDYDGEATFEQIPTNIVLPPFNPISLALGFDPTQPLPIDPLLATQFADGAPLGEQTGDASITMPDQISVGIAVSPMPAFTLMAEWQWVHWALFDTLRLDFGNLDDADDPVIVEDYKNTNGFRFGLEVMANDKLTLRGGYLYHQGAAPPETVTPLLPEGTRNEFTGGFGYRFSDRFSVDVAYQAIRQNKRRGRVAEREPGMTATEVINEVNSGLYKFNAHLFGVTLTAAF
ncbi:MAG: outer membrane protein transport protein [Gemmatimonadota bacterium]|nr:outer membrane protein transport protein [Gemmatimonadota bacterium]